MPRMIKATALSRIMGLSPSFITNKHYRKNPIGAIVSDGILYYNLLYAKDIATAYSIYTKKPLWQILQEIEDYSP